MASLCVNTPHVHYFMVKSVCVLCLCSYSIRSNQTRNYVFNKEWNNNKWITYESKRKSHIIWWNREYINNDTPNKCVRASVLCRWCVLCIQRSMSWLIWVCEWSVSTLIMHLWYTSIFLWFAHTLTHPNAYSALVTAILQPQWKWIPVIPCESWRTHDLDVVSILALLDLNIHGNKNP